LAEFQNYCLHQIPSVAWKAERQRFISTGEMERLQMKLGIARRNSGGLNKAAEELIDVGEEIFRSTKLFWKNNLDVEIRMFYCEKLDVVTIQLWETQTFCQLPCLYIHPKDCRISESEVEESVQNALKTSDVKRSSNENEEEALIRKKTEWNFIGKYLLARLKLKQESSVRTHLPLMKEDAQLSVSKLSIEDSNVDLSKFVASVGKLTGDTFETLTISKPPRLADPPEVEKKKSWDEFNQTVESIGEVTRHARMSRQSAQELTNMIHLALDEVQEEISAGDAA